ncbi:MAG: nucleoside hydrolase [Verrucomicrobiota bacterium]
MKFWVISLLGFFLSLHLAHAETPKIIFDTDITGDVDDVLALAMLHNLADRGACELLGVTISKQNPLTAAFVDAQNTFHGRPDLPIGVTRDATAQKRDSRYLRRAESPNYKHDITSNDAVPEAVSLLRQLLAAQPDGSVSIISVGIAANMANLLRSPGDAHSPLAGPALIRQKVKLLSIMAGGFATIESNNHFLEANVINGIPAMQTVAQDWPVEVPVVWSGYEIGVSLPYPRQSIARDFDYLPHHLVKEAYLLYCGSEHDRPCWDQSSVLYAVFPEREYFGLSQAGRVSVAADGFTRFTLPKKDDRQPARDRFLTLTPAQRARALEAMVHLTAQPPHHD